MSTLEDVLTSLTSKGRYKYFFGFVSTIVVFTVSLSSHFSPLLLIFYENDSQINTNKSSIRAIAYSGQVGVAIASIIFVLRDYLQKKFFYLNPKYIFTLYYTSCLTSCFIFYFLDNLWYIYGIVIGIIGWLSTATYCDYFLVFEERIVHEKTQDYMVVAMFIGWDSATAITAATAWISYSIANEADIQVFLLFSFGLYLILAMIYGCGSMYVRIESFTHLMNTNKNDKIVSVLHSIKDINSRTNQKTGKKNNINSKTKDKVASKLIKPLMDKDNDNDNGNELIDQDFVSLARQNSAESVELAPLGTSKDEAGADGNTDDKNDEKEAKLTMRMRDKAVLAVLYTLIMLSTDMIDSGIIFYQIKYFVEYFINDDNLHNVFLWTLIAAIVDIPLPPIIGIYAIAHDMNNLVLSLTANVLKMICLILMFIYHKQFISLIIICIVRLLNNLALDLMERYIISEYGEFGVTLLSVIEIFYFFSTTFGVAIAIETSINTGIIAYIIVCFMSIVVSSLVKILIAQKCINVKTQRSDTMSLKLNVEH